MTLYVILQRDTICFAGKTPRTFEFQQWCWQSSQIESTVLTWCRGQRVSTFGNVLLDLWLPVSEMPDLGPGVSTTAIKQATSHKKLNEKKTHIAAYCTGNQRPQSSQSCATAWLTSAEVIHRLRWLLILLVLMRPSTHSSLRANPRRILRGSVPLLGSGWNCGKPRLSSLEVISREPFFISAICHQTLSA